MERQPDGCQDAPAKLRAGGYTVRGNRALGAPPICGTATGGRLSLITDVLTG